MDEKKELIQFLEDDMREQSALVVDQIGYEIKAMEEKQIQQFTEGLSKEIESYTERELNDLKKSSATLSSQNKLKIQRNLLSQRQQLVSELFSEAEKEIQKFVASKDYNEFLKKYLTEIEVQGGIFYVRKEDEGVLKTLLKEMNFDAVVKEVPLKLGGFRYVHEKNRIEVDSTLDKKLENQKEWFETHSGLIV
ncbi:MAG: V-type ATP synthase subunit E [Anaerorhabdus sp.]